MVKTQSANIPISNYREKNAVFQEDKGSDLCLESCVVKQLLETVTVTLVSEEEFNIVPVKGTLWEKKHWFG